ncbi:MAG: hypothetical protein DCF23_01420 [Cyanobium sp.]|nr:MAG: hypothetical protein DCF23_01420 [Cyanobium sp.]
MEFSLNEGLNCTPVVQRHGISISTLAKWFRQARTDRGDFGPPDQSGPAHQRGRR